MARLHEVASESGTDDLAEPIRAALGDAGNSQTMASARKKRMIDSTETGTHGRSFRARSFSASTWALVKHHEILRTRHPQRSTTTLTACRCGLCVPRCSHGYETVKPALEQNLLSERRVHARRGNWFSVERANALSLTRVRLISPSCNSTNETSWGTHHATSHRLRTCLHPSRIDASRRRFFAIEAGVSASAYIEGSDRGHLVAAGSAPSHSVHRAGCRSRGYRRHDSMARVACRLCMAGRDSFTRSRDQRCARITTSPRVRCARRGCRSPTSRAPGTTRGSCSRWSRTMTWVRGASVSRSVRTCTGSRGRSTLPTRSTTSGRHPTRHTFRATRPGRLGAWPEYP